MKCAPDLAKVVNSIVFSNAHVPRMCPASTSDVVNYKLSKKEYNEALKSAVALYAMLSTEVIEREDETATVSTEVIESETAVEPQTPTSSCNIL